MILLLYIFLLLLVVMLTCIKLNKFVNISVITVVAYVPFLLISKIGPYGMYKTENNSTIFILINLIVILLTFLIFSLRKFSTKNNVSMKIENGIPRYINGGQFLKLLRISFLIFGIYVFVKVVILVLAGYVSYSAALRALAFSEENNYVIFGNDLTFYLYMFGFKGFVLFDMIMQLTNSIFGKEKMSKLAIINFGLYCMTLLSRMEVARIIVIYFLIRVISNKKLNYKINKKSKMIFSVMLIIFITVSSFRVTGDRNIIEYSFSTLIKYFTGPYVAFDLLYQDYQSGYRIVESFFLNFITILFHGVVRVANIFTSILGWDIVSYGGILSAYTDYGLYIGLPNRFNAFYTMFFPILYSSGMGGSILFSFCFGFILAFVHNIFLKYNNSSSLALYVFVGHVLIFGTIRWELSNLALWVSLSFILIEFFRQNIKNRKFVKYN